MNGKTLTFLRILFLLVLIGGCIPARGETVSQPRGKRRPSAEKQKIEERGVPQHGLTESDRGMIIIPDSVLAQRHATLADLLQGQVAGLQASSFTGAPGAALEMQFRNRGTIRGDLYPTYILDGVVLNTPMQDNANPWSGFDQVYYQSLQNTLISIDSRNIESIEVIKETSATALYGDRGANGVVIIRTRSGAPKTFDVNVSANWGVKSIARRLDLLDAAEYADYMARRGIALESSESYDWQDEIFRPALNQNYNIGLSGTSGRTSYNLAGWITSDGGVIRSTGSNGVGLLTALDQQVSKNLRAGVRMLVDRSVVNSTSSSAYLGATSVMTAVLESPYVGDGENALSMLRSYDDRSTMWRLLPQAYLNWKISRSLSFDVQGGLDFIDKKRYLWMGDGVDKGAFENSRAGRSDLRTANYNVRAALKGDFRFGERHRLRLMAMGEFFGNNSSSLLTSASDFVDGSLGFEGISLGADIHRPSFTKNDYSEIGVAGEVAYSFGGLYAISGGLRADCIVDMDTEMELYPFASASVNISNHSFWEPMRRIIPKFELRGGYGASGRSSVEPYSNLTRYTLGDATLWVPYQKQLYYKGMWRSVLREWHVGLNMEFLSGRMGLDVAYYDGETSDRLQVRDSSPDRIYDISWQNSLAMDRHGVEITLSGEPIRRRKMSLSLSATVSFARNVITDCGTDNLLGATGRYGFRGNPVGVANGGDAYVSAFVEGAAPGVFYGYRTQGVVGAVHMQQTPPFEGRRLQVGDVKFIDVNQDGQVDQYDKVAIGNPNPKALLGFQAKFRYKRFSASMSIDGALGGDVLNLNLLSLGNVAGRSNLSSEKYASSLSGKGPALGGFGTEQISDRLVEDGSYCRLTNLVFSYSFALPKRVKWISALEVNLMLNNLFTVTGYSGYDPAVNSYAGDWTLNRVDMGSYPRARFVSLGFSARF